MNKAFRFGLKRRENVSVLHLKKGQSQDIVISGNDCLLPNYDANYYDDKVLLNGDLFKKLFKSPRYASRKEYKLLTVIKVKYKGGGSIHRAFYGKKGITGLDTNKVGLSYNSIRYLCKNKVKPEDIKEVTISKGSKFLYFWNHPYHATRISARLGFFGILLTLLALLLSFY